jgi:hypothetical protein
MITSAKDKENIFFWRIGKCSGQGMIEKLTPTFF